MTIIEIVARETGQPVDESTLIETLDVDSLELLDMLMVIEELTGTRIPDSAIANIQTVGDIVRLAA